MVSMRERVLEGWKALVASALPDARVERNRSFQLKLREGGMADLYDGSPGDPEVDFSPVTYNYSHQTPLVLTGWDSASRTREEILDTMSTAIAAAIVADRTLGGLCCWIDATGPEPIDAETLAADAPAVLVTLIAQYSTSTPL